MLDHPWSFITAVPSRLTDSSSSK
ncbi:hypothetical protein LJS90_004071 [Salmonella enterica]|nr:hypothetical protein [Salmonella enterica]HAZ2792971.1 hypothetical protein [Salmonella enterica]